LAPVPLSPHLGRKSLRDMGGPNQIVSLAAASSMSDPVYATYQTGARPHRSCTFAAGRRSSRAGVRSARPLCINCIRGLSIHLQRNATAGAPKGYRHDEDFDILPPPPNTDSQRASASAQLGAWEQLFVFLIVECFLTWILIYAHLMHYPMNVEFPRVF
jgi:hypothetical protein